MDQSASFFDPNNRKAALIREQAALDALDDLLDYILEQGGSVGILDATNSKSETVHFGSMTRLYKKRANTSTKARSSVAN